MLHLALKAFYPAHAAVPAAARRHDLEVPRDDRVPRRDGDASSGSSCSCTSTRRRSRTGINPFTHGSAVHTDVMKTAGAEAGARQVRLRRGVRRRAARRGEVARQGAHLLVPLGAAPLGPEAPAPRALAPLQRAQAQGREHPRVPALELDRARRLAIHLPARTSRSCRSTSPRERPVVRARRHADHGRRRPHAAASRARRREMQHGALPHARLLSADRRDRERRRHAAGDHPGDAADARPPSARAA